MDIKARLARLEKGIRQNRRYVVVPVPAGVPAAEALADHEARYSPVRGLAIPVAEREPIPETRP